MRDYADADRDFGGYAFHAAASHGSGKAGVELVMLMVPLAMMILMSLLVATMTTTIRMSMPLALMCPLLMGEQRLRLTVRCKVGASVTVRCVLLWAAVVCVDFSRVQERGVSHPMLVGFMCVESLLDPENLCGRS